MADELNGTKILVIATNYGVEQDEIVVPVEQLREKGAAVTIAAKEQSPIQTLVGDKDPGQQVDVDLALDEADESDHDAILIPGGTINADTLRREPGAIALVTAFADAGKPIAAICHGPWLLVEAGILPGRTITSFHTLQTDIRNAGAEWVDREVEVDVSGGYTLITSRNPGDLQAFVPAIEGAVVPVG
ncbi:type 1 glutamine amidotransferase domain-containing protein [Curtobacterium sp. MCBD17_040]|uniref:type 1 glutamine amidotransferase domain-containing protein n=1 Tax=Curtobacterium sp. MCBD17_040 TaxID=2175674 RepID=UPI000DA8246D|nr:type 1 glutamine amidotransferase domain-containing protein [Curtobacterium sp. MCBD17_040]WIB63811.1 type 1 glutamine amidotransferase domain-containing protein [Curtobacterium sp. MCBD17_040]